MMKLTLIPNVNSECSDGRYETVDLCTTAQTGKLFVWATVHVDMFQEHQGAYHALMDGLRVVMSFEQTLVLKATTATVEAPE
jgi:hypothetical protein